MGFRPGGKFSYRRGRGTSVIAGASAETSAGSNAEAGGVVDLVRVWLILVANAATVSLRYQLVISSARVPTRISTGLPVSW